MNFLKIFQLILAIAPAGIQLTQEILTLVSNVETAINAAPGTTEHSAAVEQLNTTIASKVPGA